jgi:acetyl-CoA carboxylase biotin carboxyl carrier protein
MQAFLAQQRREAKNTDQVQAEQNHDHAAQSRTPVLVGLKDLANLYGSPSPGKPPFVARGDELSPGTTICLLEVMKTFHRVTYSGEPARVGAVLVAEGADVNAGDPLLALE